MNIYIGNIAHATTEQELTELFSQYGTVGSAKIIMDQYSGQSRGFAFVEMEKNAEAKKAIAELDGKEHNGRQLKVNEAKPRENRSGGGGGGGGRDGKPKFNRW